MIRNNQRFLNFLNAFSDGVIVFCTYLFSAWLYLRVFKNDKNLALVTLAHPRTLIIPLVYTVITVLMLAIFRIYNSGRIRRLRVEVPLVWESNLITLLVVGMLLYLMRLTDFSRGVLALSYFLSSIMVCIKRYALRRCLMYMRARGYNQKYVVVAGTGLLAKQYAEDVETEPEVGMHIVGFVGVDEQHDHYLGSFEQLEVRLQDNSIDEVVVALDAEELSHLRTIIMICEKCGTKVSVVPFYNDVIPAHPTIETIGKTKLINLRANPLDNMGYAAIKRGFDIFVSAVLLVLLSPLFLVVVIGIKMTSPGPIFFKQQRVGRGKKNFTMLKFRSMRVNAAETTGWTTSNDPRKTRFGSFLRKFSIDEMPQLINVFKGDMSLIGPRPEIPFYVEQFKKSVPLYMVKHQVRPGMTGWAQVNGYRGDTSIVKRIEHDVWYIEHWSIRLDLKILWMTAWGGWINKEALVKSKTATQADAGDTSQEYLKNKETGL